MSDIFQTPTVLFDLYHLLVNMVFGSVGVAIIGMAIILALMLMLGRSSLVFMFMWLVVYLITMSVLYFGGIAFVLAFIVGFMYLITSLIRLALREG